MASGNDSNTILLISPDPDFTDTHDFFDTSVGNATPHTVNNYDDKIFHSDSEYKFNDISARITGANCGLNVSDMELGTGSFTIDFWAYFQAVNIYRRMVTSNVGPFASDMIVFRTNSDASITYWLKGSGATTSASQVTTSTWYHFMITYEEDGDAVAYQDGEQILSFTPTNNELRDELWFGGSSAIQEPVYGYMSEIRVSDIVRETDEFTPPTEPYGEPSTDDDSERSLYLEGYDTNNSERGLYTQGYLTNSSERGLYTEGYVSNLYSRESASDLETDDTVLTTQFSEQDYTDVGTDNDTYVDLQGTAQYMKFLFKEVNDNETNEQKFDITWKGKSSLAPSSATVYLQVYNRTDEVWENLDSDNSSSSDTKFTLSGTQSTDLSDYYDENYLISCRVYQQV
jgi:hypothetical protein